jgi:HNH endonuclease
MSAKNSKCIFCETPLDSRTTPEHILLNCLGGKWEVKDAICSDCNNRFGGSIDKTFGEQTVHLRNLLQIKSGRNAPPPAVRSKTAGNKQAHVSSDGKVRIKQKPFEIKDGENGNKNLQVMAQSWEEIDQQIPNMSRALKISEEKLKENLAQSEASVVTTRPDALMFSLNFGGPDAIRAVAKACMVLWSRSVGTEECRGDAYQEVRNFVVNGDDAFLKNRTELDGRPLPDNGKFIKEFGPAFSYIYVRSDDKGRVIGHFTLLNLTGFQVVLAESGGTPTLSRGYINDPLSRKESRQAENKYSMPVSWLEVPEYDLGGINLQNRLGKIMEHYQKTGTDKEILRIMHDTFRDHGIKEGEAISPNAIKDLSSRIAYHFVGLPLTRKVNKDDMQKRFGAPPPK